MGIVKVMRIIAEAIKVAARVSDIVLPIVEKYGGETVEEE